MKITFVVEIKWVRLKWHKLTWQVWNRLSWKKGLIMAKNLVERQPDEPQAMVMDRQESRVRHFGTWHKKHTLKNSPPSDWLLWMMLKLHLKNIESLLRKSTIALFADFYSSTNKAIFDNQMGFGIIQFFLHEDLMVLLNVAIFQIFMEIIQCTFIENLQNLVLSMDLWTKSYLGILLWINLGLKMASIFNKWFLRRINETGMQYLCTCKCMIGLLKI